MIGDGTVRCTQAALLSYRIAVCTRIYVFYMLTVTALGWIVHWLATRNSSPRRSHIISIKRRGAGRGVSLRYECRSHNRRHLGAETVGKLVKHHSRMAPRSQCGKHAGAHTDHMWGLPDHDVCVRSIAVKPAQAPAKFPDGVRTRSVTLTGPFDSSGTGTSK